TMQVVDIFTKPLKADLFLKFKKTMDINKFEELGLRKGSEVCKCQRLGETISRLISRTYSKEMDDPS
ncbi:unnamed protein product, partial [Dovyalis caffra]